MKTILIEISFGELLDKISILEIKKERIKDPSKLKFINNDLDLLKIQLHKVAEPSSFKSGNKLFELFLSLKEINQKGTTIVIATHDYEVIRKYPSRTIQCANKNIQEIEIKDL